MEEYIGVLDSGVGGLSVLKELFGVMPDENYIYFGDTKNIPYGTKTKDELCFFTKKILDFFVSKNVKTVVFGCNTTSAVAYDELKKDFDDKLTIFPLIQTVAYDIQKDLKDNDTVAILATKATTNSNKYAIEIKKYNSTIKTTGIDCTGFTEIVENRLYEDKSSIDLIKSKLNLIKDASRVVLGCTHYPYLVNIFKKYLKTDYYNPAINLAKIVKNSKKPNPNGKGSIDFYVTKDPFEFKQSAKLFMDINQDIKLIKL